MFGTYTARRLKEEPHHRVIELADEGKDELILIDLSREKKERKNILLNNTQKYKT